MTMITGYKLKEGGFLQADILLTCTNSTWLPSSQIPSFQTNAESLGLQDHTVVGLCQKILVVNDDFAVAVAVAVAFAGEVAAIQEAIRLINSLIDQDPVLTGKRFVNAILADNRLKRAEFCAIAVSAEDDEICITNFGAQFGTANDNFEMYVGGSGSDHPIKHYEEYPSHAFDVPQENIVVHGTCMALHEFSGHLIDEFENKFESQTIADLFGGGYEVVAYHGGRFNKISDVVYAYADATWGEDGILQIDLPKFLLKSCYQRDHLKIRSVEIYYDKDEEEHRTRNDRTFTIPPISRYSDSQVEEDCDDIRFIGKFLCYLVKVKMPFEYITIPFIRKYDHHLGFLAKAFAASVSKDHVRIIYSETFEQELTAQVTGHIQQLQALHD